MKSWRFEYLDELWFLRNIEVSAWKFKRWNNLSTGEKHAGNNKCWFDQKEQIICPSTRETWLWKINYVTVSKIFSGHDLGCGSWLATGILQWKLAPSHQKFKNLVSFPFYRKNTMAPIVCDLQKWTYQFY